MLRQRTDEAVILADESGVRAAMNEIGAQAVGRAYDVEPVAVRGGCFHAKVSCMLSKTDAHLLVGSGNLTFGGWGSNVECIEHLHPTFAADAFLDAADFFRSLADSPRLKHATGDICSQLGSELAGHAERHPRNGQIRLVHNLRSPISDQLAAFANELGGATSLSVASPFFDHTGISILCSKLGLNSARIHVHPRGTVLSSAGTNWPSGPSGAMVEAVTLEPLEGEDRLLHAKLYEIVCRKGRIVMSGSANATAAGLEVDRNVELCVVRIQREKSTGWRFAPASPPIRQMASPEESAAPETVAVLRASLSGSRITGRIVSAFTAGDVTLYKKSSLRWEPLGITAVTALGDFEFDFGDGWKLASGGQFLLRVEHANGARAQGFVAMPELREIARRIGASSVHFFSLLQNKETPADVAAILEFIYAHPEWLPRREFSGGGGSSHVEPTEPTQVIDLDVLAATEQTWNLKGHQRAAVWSYEARFMSQVFAAFSQRRGPLDATATNQQADDDDDGGGATKGDVDRTEGDSARALACFERLLNLLLDQRPEANQPVRAAQIMRYVVERLQVESLKVYGYLDRLVRAFTHANVAADDADFAQAIMLVWASNLPVAGEQKAMALRRQLLRVFRIVPETPPPLERASDLQERFAATEDLKSLWIRAGGLEIIQEEIKRYWADGSTTPARDDYPLLSALPEWHVLQAGRSARVLRMAQASDHCPACHLGFSSVDALRIRKLGVVTCRGKVLLCEEF